VPSDCLSSDIAIDKLSTEVMTVPMFDQGAKDSDEGADH